MLNISANQNNKIANAGSARILACYVALRGVKMLVTQVEFVLSLFERSRVQHARDACAPCDKRLFFNENKSEITAKIYPID